MTWFRSAIGFGIATALACGSGDGDKVEENAPVAARARPVKERLEDQLLALLGTKYKVTFKSATCPDTKVEKGAAVDCAVVTANGSKLPVTVTWTGDGATFEYSDKGVILLDKVERALEVQLDARGTPGKVDCLGKLRASEPSSSFDCKIVYANGKQGVVTNKITDWTGHFTWEWEQE